MIGFIGLGIMGKPMAKNLLKAGKQLAVYDIVADALKEVEAAVDRVLHVGFAGSLGSTVGLACLGSFFIGGHGNQDFFTASGPDHADAAALGQSVNQITGKDN